MRLRDLVKHTKRREVLRVLVVHFPINENDIFDIDRIFETLYLISKSALRCVASVRQVPLKYHDNKVRVPYIIMEGVHWHAETHMHYPTPYYRQKRIPRSSQVWKTPLFEDFGIHRSPVNSTHKGQWRGALMFSLICTRINGWVNNGDAGDLRCYRVHCDVIVMNSEWAIIFQF